MMRTIIVLAFMVLSSCVKSERSGEVMLIETNDTIVNSFFDGKTTSMKKRNYQNDVVILSSNLDEVEVLCMFFGDNYDKSVRIFLSNTYINIVNASDGKDTIHVSNVEIRNRAIKYINQFYIDKKEKIIVNRTKREYFQSSDYPYIQVIGYRDVEVVFKNKTQIGDEVFDVEFHPVFLEFHKFLIDLVNIKE